MKRRQLIRMPMLVMVLLATMVVATGAGDRLLTHFAYAMERGKIQANAEELATVREVARAFRMVAKVAKPGVVHIRVRAGDTAAMAEIDELLDEIRNQTRRLRNRLEEDPSPALRRELAEMLQRESQAEARRRQLLLEFAASSGSGFMLDREGHILTNNHVVEGSAEVLVRLHDDREYMADVLATDSKTDLAVVKIDAGDLHPLKFGNSDEMEVGDWVIAVGAPFGLSQTVTHGIISAKGRGGINTPIYYQDFLQTDAAINPGNSGGPLLNLKGEVIGVNTAIATTGNAYNAGIAFTIPANTAQRIARELIETGVVARGWLGISMAELTPADREALGLETDAGVLVDRVLLDTPADEAGLRMDDVIVSVNGEAVRDAEDVKQEIGRLYPGQEATISGIRNGEPYQLTVSLGRQPQQIGRAAAAPARRTAELERLGIDVRAMFPSRARLFGYSRTDRGLLVTRLDEDSPLRGEVQPGELIVSVEGTDVKNVSGFQEALREARGSRIEMQVKDRDGDLRRVRFRRN